jgi:eukaryotic-like serine/threonine-protein kinase
VAASEPMTTLAGRYRLLELVGEGGMGVVWRAYDRTLGRDVAIKLLKPIVASEAQQRRRFEREARTLAGLANEHIVRVHDYVDDGQQAFLVMEYVDGPNLAEMTFAHLPLSVGEAAWYAAPVAEALAYAHAKGVVHRDLTPANILIEQETGRVVTTDFGLARVARGGGSLTTAGMLVGTPEYWSPELALGRETGTACDLYALGCILYLLVGGRLPFEGDDRLAVGLRRAHEHAPSLASRAPGVSAAVVELVDSLLSMDPGGRPDAAATAASLSALAAAAERPTRSINRRHEAPTAVTVARPTGHLSDALPAVSGASAAEEASTLTPSPAGSPRSTGLRVKLRSGGHRRRLLVLGGVAGLLTAAVAVWLHERPVGRVPEVVSLRSSAARAQILQSLPGATVSVRWVYSTRVAAGRVISQRPAARTSVGRRSAVTLTVSKGTPFAEVPAVAVSMSVPAARETLAQTGFAARLHYTPSWTVRKGTVIETRPHAGVRLRRPAVVSIIVASGYPREIVPQVISADLASAQSRLEAKHLRYQIVYRLMPNGSVNQVVGQIPSAGAIVYRGSRIRLTVARMYHWVNLFRWSGMDRFQSDLFTVPARWRIRYQLAATASLPALAQFFWSPNGDLFAGHGFVAGETGNTDSYVVRDGAGTYQLTVDPLSGTNWSVEVDAFE